MQRKNLLRFLALALTTLNIVSGVASAEIIYDNDLSLEASVSAYNKSGNEAKVISLKELSSDIETESIALSEGITVIEIDLFPSELSGVSLDAIWIEGVTKTPFISFLSDGIILMPESENVFGSEEFILDWYTLKILIYNGESVQVFLNNCEIIPKIAVSLSPECKFVLNSCEEGNILIDNLLVRTLTDLEVQRSGFLKNGVPVFSSAVGDIKCGTSVCNGSREAAAIKFILAVYDSGGNLVEAKFNEKIVLPDESVDLSEEITIAKDKNLSLVSFVWNGKDLIPLLPVDSL